MTWQERECKVGGYAISANARGSALVYTCWHAMKRMHCCQKSHCYRVIGTTVQTIIVCLMVMCGQAPANTANRVALIIGNDTYTNLPAHQQLRKARNDAKAAAKTFRDLGFDVLLGLDLGRSQINRKLQELVSRITPGDTVSFYFAGHGVRIDGRNFLLPSDVPQVGGGQADYLKAEAIGVDLIVDMIQSRGARLSLLVLDACRDNPFKDKRGRSVGGRRGLARMDPPEGTLILFSAGAGQQALDRLADNDPHPNSIFTRTLLPLLAQKGQELSQLTRRVKRDVRALARTVSHRQTPAVYNEVIGDVYLAGRAVGPAPKSAAKSTAKLSNAAQAWNAIEDTKSRAVLESFIRAYPATVFATFANARLKELADQRLAMTQQQQNLPAARPRAILEPGTEFQDCPKCPRMVVLPPGQFKMGSPRKERGREKDEGPRHAVSIARAFAVGKYEVTRGQYAAFVLATGQKDGGSCWSESKVGKGDWKDRSGRGWRTPGFEQTDDHPVVCVSWHDAKTYAAWVSQRTGKTYRLLSEAEWEYAARAGSDKPYSYGSGPSALCEHANGADLSARRVYGRNLATYRCNDGYVHTAPVGRFRANAFGLHDMHGNVVEWVEDVVHANYKRAPHDGSAWVRGGNQSRRVLRGGAWGYGQRYLRSADRDEYYAGARGNYGGFRIASSLPELR
ncbi:MAG: SUMF1/EgtB/PvdO family nonheme iron enzyme [Hyphomicrobiaceae bacterium]